MLIITLLFWFVFSSIFFAAIHDPKKRHIICEGNPIAKGSYFNLIVIHIMFMQCNGMTQMCAHHMRPSCETLNANRMPRRCGRLYTSYHTVIV